MIVEKPNTKQSNLKSLDGEYIIEPFIDKLDHRPFNAILEWKVVRKIVHALDPSLIKEIIDSQLSNNNVQKGKKPAIAILDRLIHNQIIKFMPRALKSKNILDKIRQCLGYIVKVVMEVNGFEKVDCIEYRDGIIIHNGSHYTRV